MCSGILCVHKKTFQSLNKATIIVPSARPRVRFAIFHLNNKMTRFSKFDQCFHDFEEFQKSARRSIRDVFCPGRFCSEQECVYVHKWEK